MKIQLAYRYTGEKKEDLINYLKKIKSILELNKHNVYVPLLDPNHSEDTTTLFFDVLEKIKNIDSLLIIMKSKEKSEGMLMEIGCALSNKKNIILAIQNDITETHLLSLANKIIKFNNLEDLYAKLKDIK